MKNTEGAFQWIIDILESHKIPYKISGGLAARAHGSRRALADIDIEVADADVYKIAEYVKPYITFGPTHHKTETWEMELVVLEFEEQEIEIYGAEAKFFNPKTKLWERCSNLQNIEMKEVFGRIVPVESQESLIAYKSKLAREVDLEDLRQLGEAAAS